MPNYNITNPFPTSLLTNETWENYTMINTTIAPNTSLEIATRKYYIRNHDRIDTFCYSREPGMELTHFLICGLVQSIVHILGIIANILTMFVLRKPDSHAVVYVFFKALLFSDLLVLSVNWTTLILPQFMKYLDMSPDFVYFSAPYIAMYAYPVVNIVHTTITYFTAFAILERYVVVCRPFSYRRLCSIHQSYKIVLGVYIAAVIVNFPRFFEYEVISVTSEVKGEVYDLAPKGLMKVRDYRKWYLWVTWFMTRFVIPFSLMLFSSFGVIFEILKSFIKREMLSAAKRHETTLAKICILIVFVFLLCHAPTSYSRVSRGFRAYKPEPKVLYPSNVLIAINSSIKWAIFCLFKQRFRTHYLQLVSLPCSCIIEIRGWLTGNRKHGSKRRNSLIVLHNGENLQECEADEV